MQYVAAGVDSVAQKNKWVYVWETLKNNQLIAIHKSNMSKKSTTSFFYS